MSPSDLVQENVLSGPRLPRLAQVRFAGLRLGDALLIGAILGLVLVVSLPRIEAFARTTNESDARLVTALLGQRLLGGGLLGGAPLEEARELSADLPALVAADEYLEHRLRDARRLPDTEILLFHGYYYRLDHGASTLVAWPRIAGGTGRPAFAWRAGAGLLVHANEQGHWSGRASEVSFELEAGEGSPWKPIETPGL